jgi:hypothetical protein
LLALAALQLRVCALAGSGAMRSGRPDGAGLWHISRAPRRSRGSSRTLDGRHVVQDAARDRGAAHRARFPEASTSAPTAKSSRHAGRRTWPSRPSWRRTIAAAQIALALPAGYALAKLRFVGRRFAFGVVLACLARAGARHVRAGVPDVREGAFVNTMTALVLPFAASALGTFLVRQALLSVPDEIIEAARMDGASEWTIVYRRPRADAQADARVALSRELRLPLQRLLLAARDDDGRRRAHAALGVALLREQGTGARWHIVMAGNVVLSAPVLALFAVAQKHLMRAVRKGGTNAAL